MNIILEIAEKAQNLVEEDLDRWIVPNLFDMYRTRIDSYATKVYGAGHSNVTKEAFRASAQELLKKATGTFLFKSQHWKNGRDLNTYLLTCLKRFAEQTAWDFSAAKRANSLICPGCKDLGTRVFLQAEDKLWRCPVCTTSAEIVPTDANAHARVRLHKAFSLHTRKGYRCPEPDCSRFIPESMNGKFGITCPYPDCSYFGDVNDLVVMAHPYMMTRRQMVSLNQPIPNKSGTANTSLQDTFEAELVSADDKLAISQNFLREYKILMSVINAQIDSVKRNNSGATRMQKLLMYESFRALTEQSSEEMISYLCHMKQSAETPIQARIFQEYVARVENAIPFNIERYGEKTEILSISDPELALFQGLSTFETSVKDNGIIPNDTIETYTGSRVQKKYGPYFIGRLIDITCKDTGVSLLDKVIRYSFIDIETSLQSGRDVVVKHYRIFPHYEMGHMVFLQRIRKQIVNKVYRLLNGTKRVVGKH